MINDLVEWKEKLRITNKLIIVEGKKDKNALNYLGITNIFVLNNKPLYKVVEDAAKLSKEIIILTDLDSEGRKLYSILKIDLQKHGVKIDNEFREFLIRNTEMSCIEGIKKLF